MIGRPLATDTELAPLERTITLTDMVAYAGATWDWHRMHYDPDFLAERRLPAPVVDGQLFGALLTEQIQDALGPRAFVRRLHLRFKNPVFAGETVRCAATVVTIERLADGGTLLVLRSRVDVVSDRARTAVAPAGAEVVLR
jgi:acyl dehydratase